MQKRNARLFIQLLERSNLSYSDDWSYRKLKAGGYMDLHIDRLAFNRDRKIARFAIAHNGVLNGDKMADPDMEFTLDWSGDAPQLAAITYQNDYLGVFQSVEQASDLRKASLQRELDGFIGTWLRNLLEQGHIWQADEGDQDD